MSCKKLFRALRPRGYSTRVLRKIKEEVLAPPWKKETGRSFKCNLPRCGLCKFVRETRTVAGFSLKTAQHCGSKNGIYLLECEQCIIGYVGETKNTFRTRINQHLSDIRLKKDTLVAEHVNKGECSGASYAVVLLETFQPTQIDNMDKSQRLQNERRWSQRCFTYHPHGLNQIPIPLDTPLIPLVLPYSSSATEIMARARNMYAKLQTVFPGKFYHRFLPAFSRNPNLRDKLVRSALGRAPLPAPTPKTAPKPNGVPPSQDPPALAILNLPPNQITKLFHVL